MQAGQLRPRIDAELIGQPAPEPVVAEQRVALPIGQVQRDHQLTHQLLVPGVLGDQFGQLAENGAGPAHLDLQFQPANPHAGTPLVQPAGRRGERGGGEAVERGTTPEREGRREQLRCRRVVAAAGLPLRLGDPAFEVVESTVTPGTGMR